MRRHAHHVLFVPRLQRLDDSVLIRELHQCVLCEVRARRAQLRTRTREPPPLPGCHPTGAHAGSAERGPPLTPREGPPELSRARVDPAGVRAYLVDFTPQRLRDGAVQGPGGTLQARGRLRERARMCARRRGSARAHTYRRVGLLSPSQRLTERGRWEEQAAHASPAWLRVGRPDTLVATSATSTL